MRAQGAMRYGCSPRFPGPGEGLANSGVGAGGKLCKQMLLLQSERNSYVQEMRPRVPAGRGREKQGENNFKNHLRLIAN